MEDTTALTRLQALTERDLLGEVLVPLFSAIGYDRISIEGGPNEEGRDLICARTDEFGETQLDVVQVKRFKPSRRVGSSTSFSEIVTQLAQTLESSIPHIDGQSYLPSTVFFVTPHAIDYGVLASRFEAIRALRRGRGIRVIDGPRLLQLLKKYLPQLALRFSAFELGEEQRSAKLGDSALNQPTQPSWTGNREKEKAAFDYVAAIHHDLNQLLASADTIDPRLCFVIMSFSGNPRLADFYELAIKPTVNKLGYRCERVDEQQFNGSIRQQIFQNIQRARFVVADMTEARPNCYYELGVAHASRKEVIHLAYSTDDIHFDVKDFNFIVYTRIDKLSEALRERILETVGAANDTD